MKLCRVRYEGNIAAGRVEGEWIEVSSCAEIYGDLPPAVARVSLREAELLAPVTPSKVVAIGRNYLAHAKEMDNKPPDEEPLIFMKPSSAVIAPGAPIVLPPVSQRVDHEGELAVIIGRVARDLPADADPLSYVLGYTCLNDVTARDLQRKDVQFTRGKSFDTFCPLGPVVETELDPSSVQVQTRVNGQLRQSGNTRDLLFPVRDLIRFVTGIMTLYPGDVIATGTPAGVGPLAHGDVVEVEVEGIGVLRNPVVDKRRM
jgi:2-keto-4-pentenoate hydratase/2-oxohepta-3-ene-1,7-dioic acid hydratase in catechol pathway